MLIEHSHNFALYQDPVKYVEATLELDYSEADLQVETGDLDTTGLTTGTVVKFSGFTTPFGHAADREDFEARTLVDVSIVKGLMIVDWFPPASTAISEDISVTGCSLNLSGAGLFHRLNRAGLVIDLAQLQQLLYKIFLAFSFLLI